MPICFIEYHNRHLALLIGLLVVLAFAITARAQDHDITNEYRTTLVMSKPVDEKVILFGYVGYVKAPDKWPWLHH